MHTLRQIRPVFCEPAADELLTAEAYRPTWDRNSSCMAQHSTSHEPRRGGSDGQDGLVDLMGRLIYSFLGPPALH